jgi:hypothetical protein
MFQAIVNHWQRKKAPERLTTEFRVTEKAPKPKNLDHASEATTCKRLIATEGRNGLYAVTEHARTYDFYGGGDFGDPHDFINETLASMVGYPDGTLSREGAIEQLREFEERHPDKDGENHLKGRIPHYSRAPKPAGM